MDFVIQDPAWAKQRLDHFLQQQLPDMSRTRIQTLIKDGKVLVNEKKAKPNAALRLGDKIQFHEPEPVPVAIIPQDIPLHVLFEDEHIIVINKPAGLVVHPAAGNPDGTLVNALLFHCKNLSGIGGELRPGIVHRLDKETSGCMVAAKHDLAHTRLTEAFSQRQLTKIYLAAVNGIPSLESGRIENRIGRHPVDRKRMAVVEGENGKDAVTEWRQLCVHSGCALVECRLLTGRTHQIRVHMRENLHAAILGDTIYAQPQKQKIHMPRLMLHAWKLGFQHPISKAPMTFESAIPAEYQPWTNIMPKQMT